VVVRVLLLTLLALFLFVGSMTLPRAADIRVCGTEAVRNADGQIVRSSTVLKRFQEAHPCPSTGLSEGACPGWSKDHVIPLACGGCDSIENLQWMKNSIKSCAGTECKDRWERKIYCQPMVLVP
jgi:hypothetical protein